MTYARSELLRAFRNRRFFILSVVFPLVLFWMVAGPQRDESSLSGTGIPAPLYYMVTMAAYGGMNTWIDGGLSPDAGVQPRTRSVSSMRFFTATMTSTSSGVRPSTIAACVGSS